MKQLSDFKVSKGQRIAARKTKECRRGAGLRCPPSLLRGGVEKPKFIPSRHDLSTYFLITIVAVLQIRRHYVLHEAHESEASDSSTRG